MKTTDSPELTKLFYRIGEVSRIVGVERHVLRYWESEFPSLRPQKSKKGQRVYSRRDVAKLLRVKDLLRSQGFTIAGAKKRLGDPPEPSPQAVVAAAPAAAPAAAAAPTTISSRGVTAQPRPEPTTQASQVLRRKLVALRNDVLGLLAEFGDD